MQASFSTITKWLTFITFSFFLAACGQREQLPAIPTGATVLILGDSLSYGTGAAKGQDYPTLLAQHTGWEVINASVYGNTSQQGLDRLPALLAAHKPDFLMIELGGNDFLQSKPLAQTETNLRTIIKMAKDNSTPALLIAIPAYQPVKAALGGLSDHALYERLAEETQTPLVADIFSPVLSDNALKADYVHPNALGYQAVEQALLASLKDLGFVAQ